MGNISTVKCCVCLWVVRVCVCLYVCVLNWEALSAESVITRGIHLSNTRHVKLTWANKFVLAPIDSLTAYTTKLNLSKKYGTGIKGFPCRSVVREPARSAGNLGLILGLGRSPGEGNGNPLQYTCLENLTDRQVWWAAVHGVTKSQTRLSIWASITSKLKLRCWQG